MVYLISGKLPPVGSCGVTARFVDNGNGTITDSQTGLMWEKKQTCSEPWPSTLFNPHCVNNPYAFDNKFAMLLDMLNGSEILGGEAGFNAGPTNVCFAGHCGWRVPNIDELKTILNLNPTGTACATNPCIDPIFGPTEADFYGSSTAASDINSGPSVTNYAWGVYFDTGVVSTKLIGQGNYTRAVRGGR
jgi:hypothetical protein